MIRRIGVVVLWLLATLGTASLTYAAVFRAGQAVGDAPAMPVAASDIAARVSTTAATGTTTTSTTLSGSSTTLAVTTTVVVTTSSVPATTTTTGAAETFWKTIPGVGVVGVSVQGDAVTLVSASPVDPYHVEVEDDGPDQVEVHFDSEGVEYRVRADVEDGELRWEVTTEGEGSGGAG